MENELSAAQNAAYDYRACARVWHRVDPTLTPYPEARAAMAADTADDGLSAAEREAELARKTIDLASARAARTEE